METKGLPDKGKCKIFISHRSTDKAVADMLADFFYGTGIPREAVFCSSLPGNDVNEKISHEVKASIKNSVINIAILSRDYYDSAYCLNEAGILWYRDDVPVVPIALPEIDYNNMYGFLDNNYKLRRLDFNTDVSYIYDAVSEAVSAPHTKAGVITSEINKLMERYAAFREKRETPKTEVDIIVNNCTVSVGSGNLNIANEVATAFSENPDTARKAVSAVLANHDTARKAVSAVLANHDTASKAVLADDSKSKAVSAISENQNTANENVFAPQNKADVFFSEVSNLPNDRFPFKTIIPKTKELDERDVNLLADIVLGKATDDERIVLYYMLKRGVCRVSISEIYEWLHKNEIHNVDVDNAFDLLSALDGFTVAEDILELKINTFPDYTINETSVFSILEECVNKHKKLASDTFKFLWENGRMRHPVLGLFIAYIIDERKGSLFVATRINVEISNIKAWEFKKNLDATLSNNYEDCLSYFIENDLVYGRYGGRNMGFTMVLPQSLQNLLFNNSKPYRDFLNMCKQSHKK